MRQSLACAEVLLLSIGCARQAVDASRVVGMDDAPLLVMIDGPEQLPEDRDRASIASMSLSQDKVILEVRFGGGCEEHAFVLHGLPAQRSGERVSADLHLSHDGHGDRCEAWLHERLVFSLSPLLDDCARRFGSGEVALRVHVPGEEGSLVIPVSLAFP